MLANEHRNTKMIWSIGAKQVEDKLVEVVDGVPLDVVRLVYDPGKADQLAKFVKQLRSTQRNVPVAIDLAASHRAALCTNSDDQEVSYGDIIKVAHNGSGDVLPFEGEATATLFKPEATVFFGFGSVILQCRNVQDDVAELVVTQGGMLFDGMDIQVPDTMPELDLAKSFDAGLAQLLEEGVEFVIVHGSTGYDQVAEFRQNLKEKYKDACPWVIAKIDNDLSVQNIDSLLSTTEGVLISRREMSLLMNPATVPMVTKEIIQICNDKAKLVLTASEMLASMRHNVTPTRAEVSDIANAVIDGTDAVVLSEEVSMGKFGVKALEVMDMTIRDIEVSARVGQPNWRKQVPSINNSMDAIAYNAYRTAERLGAKAIVCITHEGNTALRLGSYRAPVPIIAVTFSERVQRRLSLVRGVQTLTIETDPTIDDILPVVNEKLLRDSWLKVGDPIIFVSITLSSVGQEASNLFTVQYLS